MLLPVILLTLGAFFSYEVLYLASLASFRQRWYELFLGLHIVLQLAGLVSRVLPPQSRQAVCWYCIRNIPH